MSQVKKHYCETSLGQVHLRKFDTNRRGHHLPLFCLHPAPFSGLYFETVMPLLGVDRIVIAPDYPGYGGSARLGNPPTIADYATTMLETKEALEIDEKINIIGFHTGCLVAVEMALAAPEKVGKLVLCDVPYFNAEERPGLKHKVAQPLQLTGELTSIETAWNFNVASRIDDVPLDRALELFAEQLRSGTKDYFAFDAAFSYDCETHFAELDIDTDVIATQSGLLNPSRAAAQSIPGARFVEALEINSPVFEVHAEGIATKILHSLDEKR